MSLKWSGVILAVTVKFTDDDTFDMATDEVKTTLLIKTIEKVKRKILIIINFAEQSNKSVVEATKRAEAVKIKETTEIYPWFLPLLELDISIKLVQNSKLAEVATEIDAKNGYKPRLLLVCEEYKWVLAIIESGFKNRPTLPDYKIYKLLIWVFPQAVALSIISFLVIFARPNH